MTFGMFNYFNKEFENENAVQLISRTKEPNEAGERPETLLTTFYATQDINNIDKEIKYQVFRFKEGIYDFALAVPGVSSYRVSQKWIESLG